MARLTRTLMALVFAAGAGASTLAQAPPADPRPQQEANRDQFLRFQRELLGLAQRLEASDKPADRDRAKVMRRALELISQKNVQGQLQKMLESMKDGVQPAELEGLGGRDAELNRALREIMDLLMSDDGSERNKEERERLEKLRADALAILRAQRTIRAMTESQRADPKEIAKEQEKATERTKDLAKRMGKESKAGKKGEQKPKDQKPKEGEPKDGEPKEGKPKDGEPKDGKPKDGEPKDAKPKDGKPKDGEPKQGQPKNAKPKEGQPKDAKPGEPKEGEPKQGDTPPQDQPPQTPGRKQIQEALPHQQQAENDLKRPDREQAAKAEDKAIKSIEDAIKELEKRLKQLREEEAQKLLANLESRCKMMLKMQTDIYEATKAIDADVAKAKGKKSNADIQKAQQQADAERKIVAEADKTLKLMEGEGTAVAFARVLQEVAVDMRAIDRRLGESAVGRDTQLVEENVIALLQEMVAALKKAQDDLKKQQDGQPQPGQPGQQAQQNRQLIDQLAELRLIKALQTQVNSRTKVQAARYEGEQASDPLVQRELLELGQRQEKLRDMVGKLERGENR